MAEDYSTKNVKGQLPGNQPGKIRKVEKVKTNEYLPQYLNTPVNKKFLQSTLDAMISKSNLETVDNYVGKIKGGWYDDNKDFLIGTKDTDKRYYNGQPGYVVKDADNSIIDITTVDDFLINQKNVLGYTGPKPNTAIFNYTYSPPIDYDMFVNFTNYYWVKDDLPCINVKPSAPFDPDTMVGQTRFSLATSDLGTIDFLNGFKIKFAPNATQNFTGDNTTTAFTTTVNQSVYPLNIIIVNGTRQTTGFTYTGTTLTFSSAPATNAVIEVLHFNMSDINYYANTYIVNNVGRSIELLQLEDEQGRTVLSRKMLYSPHQPSGFDMDPHDSHPYDYTQVENRLQDYVLMEPGSLDQNAWSRKNQWYHYNAIVSACTITGTELTSIANDETRARRPILQFEKDIILYNYGKQPGSGTEKFPLHKFNVDFVTKRFTGTDIIGQTNYNLLQNVLAWSTSTQYNIGDIVKQTVGTSSWYFEAKVPNIGQDPLDADLVVDTVNWQRVYDSGIQNGDRIIFIGTGNTTYDNKIFEVSGAGSSISLTQKLNPALNDKIHTIQGPNFPNNYNGADIVWHDDQWNFPQQKLSKGQAPLFDLYDENQAEIDTTYSNSDFEGSTLMNYVINSATTVDNELGFKAQYKTDAGSSELVFEHPLQSKRYNYDLNSTPKEIRGVYNYAKRTDSTTDAKILYGPHRRQFNLNRTIYASETAIAPTSGVVTIPVGSDNIKKESSIWYFEYSSQGHWVVREQHQDNPIYIEQVPTKNPDIYMYAGQTATINKDYISTETDLSFVKELDGVTAAPGVTVTDNGNSLSVAIASSGYDPVFLYKATGAGSGASGKIYVVPEDTGYAGNLNSVIHHIHTVTKNGTRVENYTLGATTTTLTGLTKGDVIELRYLPTGDKQSTSQWSTGVHFKNNPLNQDLGQHTHADLRDHFSNKMTSIPGQYASSIGVSDYYLSSKDHQYGGTILSSSYNALPFYIKDDSKNVITHIRSMMNDYDRFKKQLVNKAQQVHNTNNFTTTRELFNETMRQLNIGKDSSFKYATSGMCHWSNATTETFTISDTTQVFTLANSESNDKIHTKSNDHVYVYLKDYDSSATRYIQKLLVRGKDYTLNGNQLTLDTSANLNNNVPAVLTVDHYSRWTNSFVPWTVPKLYFKPEIRPNRIATTLLCHDGAQHTVDTTDNLHEPDKNLFHLETAILTELENRVYNGFAHTKNWFNSTEFYPRIEAIKEKYGAGDRDHWVKGYRAVFDYWIESNNKAYPSLANTGVANFSNQTDANGVTLPGTQAEVLKYLTGTETPHTTPWEMLGYFEKPFFWDTYYDWRSTANGGSDAKRTQLLNDLKIGRKQNPAAPRPNGFKLYSVKIDIGSVVNDAGALVDIVTAGIVSAGDVTKDFVIGDGTSAEDEFKKSSAYNFAIVEAGLRNAPLTYWLEFDNPSAFATSSASVDTTFINVMTRRIPTITDPVYGSMIANGTIDTISVTNQGSSYSSSPTVTITGDGSGATAEAIVVNNKIVDIKITAGGYGYTNAGVTITDTTGYFAEATVNLKYNQMYKTTGFQAMAWLYNTYNKTGMDLHARNQKTTSQPIINIEGYTSKNLIKVRTLGNSAKAPFVLQDNDLSIVLQKSATKVKFNFSAVKIKKVSAGYEVDGFEIDNKYFNYIQSLQGGTKTITQSGQSVTIYSNYDAQQDASEVAYGTTYNDLTELSNFLAGRTEYMKTKGLQTFEYDAVIREMLEWASSAAINDVHFAFGKKELLFKDSLDRFVDSVYTTNNTVLIEDRTETLLTRECGLSNLKATRNDEGAKIFTNDSSAILRMTVHFVQYEHVLVLENKTLFNDDVHRPDIAMSFDTYKLEGRRTTSWTGAPTTDGYIVERGGIRNNFESSVREVEDDYFVIDSNAVSTEKRKIAQTSIGYNKPSWADTLPISEDNSFDYYRASIQTKGSKENLKALARHQEVVDPTTDSFEIDEQWLFKTSDFAANNRNYIEMEFNENLVKVNPQGVKIASDGNADSLLDDIITVQKNDKRLITPLATTNQFTLGSDYYHQDESTFSEFDTWLKNAGYPLTSEIDEQALTVNDIPALYDSTKDYATILAWDNTTSYKQGDKVRYQDKVYQASVASTGFQTTTNPITWNGTVNNPVILPGNSLVIDGNTINLVNTVTTTTLNNIVIDSVANPVVNGGDTLVIDGTSITFVKSSTSTSYPDFAVAGSTVNPTIVGSATKTLIIAGVTVSFNQTEATTVNRDWTYCVGDQMTSATVSSITAADRITAWTNLRASLQSVYGNATTRTKLDTYLNSSEAGFDTSVLVTEHGATSNATLQGHILTFLTQDVTIINEKAGTSYVTADVLNGSTPVNASDETTTQTAFNLSTYTDDIHNWLTNSANDSTVIAGSIIVMSEAGTQYKTYSATEIRNRINAATITNVTASLVSNQLTLTRSGRTASDKDLTIGAGTANAEVDNAGTTFPASGSITHTGTDTTTTSNTAQLTNADIVDQINTVGISNIGVVLNGNQIRLTKSPTSLSPTLTLDGTAISDLGGGFTIGIIPSTSTTSSASASLSVGLVAQKINDAGLTNVTAAVVNNRIVITSLNNSGIIANTQAALDLGINTNILGVTRNATTSTGVNTFNSSNWTEIDEPLLEYIWVADDNELGYTTIDSITAKFNGWNVFKVMDFDMYASKICAATTTGEGNDAEVQCNKAHNLQKGDIVLLLNTDCKPAIDGFHTVSGTDTASTAKFFINEYIDQDASFAKVLVLRPVRFSTDNQRNSALSSSSYNFAQLDRIWVDGTKDTGFKVYTKDDTATWTILRSQGDYHVSPTTIQSSKLHNNVTTIANAEAYDPFKGIVPGIADLEIDYRSINDPAIYTASTDTTAQVNQQQAWGSDHVGEVWWDTKKAIYIDYEQSTTEYRTQNWGKLFKGGTIDVYEWTKSDVAPDQYATSVEGGKVINGVELTGEALKIVDSFGNDIYYYTEVDEYDSTIGSNVTYYYFWVKNKTSIPLGTKRISSVLNIASNILSPTAQGIKWLNATGKDSFIVSNLRDNTQENTILQITNISNMDNLHTHWTNITENQTQIPEYFHRRLKDSLRGNNEDRATKTFKGQWVNGTSYSKGEIVSVDAQIPAIKVAVQAKATTHRFYNRGSGNGYTFNDKQDDTGFILTLQRGKSYIFDQNNGTNTAHGILFSTDLDAKHRGLNYYEPNANLVTSDEGVIYMLDTVAVTVDAYNTAIGNGSNTQHKSVVFTPNENTPNRVWIGCWNHRLMGNEILIVNEERDETPSYYMSLIDSNNGYYPQVTKRAWRRIFNTTEADEIEETISIPQPRLVPDLNLHPLDRVGEGVRPSRSWFPYKNISRREVVSQVNNLLINTNLVDAKPNYKTLLDKTISIGAKDYKVGDYFLNVDWFADTFDKFVIPNREVNEITPTLTSGDADQLVGQYNGEYVLAKNVLHADGIVRDSIYEYDLVNAKWTAVYKEKGTIQLDDRLWDSVVGQTGFDNQGFDNSGFDNDPIHEFSEILDVLRTGILSDADYNKVWFASIYDAVKELPNIDWIKKSTYIIPKLSKQVNTTKRIGYDAVPIMEDYLTQNKPYTTKFTSGSPSYFQDQKTIMDQGSAIITEHERKMLITEKIQTHTENEFTENLGETAVLVNTPLPFDDVSIARTYGSNTYTVERNPIITAWQHTSGVVVDYAHTTPETQHLSDTPNRVEVLAQDIDHVYIRTCGIPGAYGGPGYNVAPNSETLVLDQRPSYTGEVKFNWKLPKEPCQATTTQDRGAGPIAVMTNGVAIFSPRDYEPYTTNSNYYRNEMYLRQYEMDPNNGTSVSSKGDNAPDVAGVYYHYDYAAEYAKSDSPTLHSGIVGWALDGYPIYGPYGFANTDGSGGIIKMTSGYTLKTGSRTGLNNPGGTYDGTYTADYHYTGASTLDQYNGRFAVTPEYPDGVYHYHVTPGVYPYVIGDQFYGDKTGTHIYDGTTVIQPWKPSVIKDYDAHDVTADGGAFTTTDASYTFIYNGQSFINQYEKRGSSQYFSDFNEALDIRVQTNPQGTVTAGATYSVNSEEANPRGITFNNDGTKMFIVGTSGDDVNEYTLSVGFDLTSTVTFIDSFAVTQCPNPTAVKFNADGTKMFVTGVGNSNVHEYALSSGFDVSTASFTQTLVTTVDNDNFGLDFKPDGTKMYITGNQNDKIYEYNLSSAFDISTATFNQDFSTQPHDFEPFGIEFSPDGTKMFIVGTIHNGVDLYHLSTGFDISTATHVEFYFVGGNPSGIHISPDGLKMFVTGNNSDLVKSYALSAPYTFTGGYPTADTRSFIYFQNNDLNVHSSVVVNNNKDTTSGSTTADASEISVVDVNKFYDPNAKYEQYYYGSLADNTHAKFGTHSMRFSNNTDSELYVPSLSTMQNGEVHFWMYMDSTATDARILTSNQWGLRRSAAGTIDVIDSAGATLGIGATGLDDGAWHHISIICDGTNLSISKDQNTPATASVTQFANISGIQFGATTRLTSTYSGSAADNVWIDQMCIRATATHTTVVAAANPPLADTGLVLENWEIPPAGPFAEGDIIQPGIVTIGTERILYRGIDKTNNKLLFCTRGAEGTSAIAHNSGSTVIDCGPNNKIPAHRQIWQYGNSLGFAYNDVGTSLAGGSGTKEETKFIRSASRGELF